MKQIACNRDSISPHIFKHADLEGLYFESLISWMFPTNAKFAAIDVFVIMQVNKADFVIMQVNKAEPCQISAKVHVSKQRAKTPGTGRL